MAGLESGHQQGRNDLAPRGLRWPVCPESKPANNSRFAMLLSLFPELRVVVARKLCVRDLVRLSRVSKQLNALCVDVGERAVQEMIAAGEDDAPLPAGLSEHVLHRLARLCGVRFVPAAFADAVFEASLNHYTDVTWDLAALEKAYVVLSERELEPYRSTIFGEWRFKVEPDCSYYWDSPDAAGGAFNFIKSVITFCEHDRDSCIARKYVDGAKDRPPARFRLPARAEATRSAG